MDKITDIQYNYKTMSLIVNKYVKLSFEPEFDSDSKDKIYDFIANKTKKFIFDVYGAHYAVLLRIADDCYELEVTAGGQFGYIIRVDSQMMNNILLDTYEYYEKDEEV